jgi:hypothetical protein
MLRKRGQRRIAIRRAGRRRCTARARGRLRGGSAFICVSAGTYRWPWGPSIVLRSSDRRMCASRPPVAKVCRWWVRPPRSPHAAPPAPRASAPRTCAARTAPTPRSCSPLARALAHRLRGCPITRSGKSLRSCSVSDRLARDAGSLRRATRMRRPSDSNGSTSVHRPSTSVRHMASASSCELASLPRASAVQAKRSVSQGGPRLARAAWPHWPLARRRLAQ